MLDRFLTNRPAAGPEVPQPRGSRIVLYAWWTPADALPESLSFDGSPAPNREVNCTALGALAATAPG